MNFFEYDDNSVDLGVKSDDLLSLIWWANFRCLSYARSFQYWNP